MSTIATLALSGALLAAVLPAAQTGDAGCSSDAFAIDGSSVVVQLCARDVNAAAKIVVTETLSVKGQTPFVREVPLDRVPGADSSRAIDDVPLTKLGLARTLHLTIAVKNGAVRLEHALLVPGAVALK